MQNGIWQDTTPVTPIGDFHYTVLVYGLGYLGGGLSIERLILAGVAISSMFGAIQTALLLLADDGRIQAALNWLIGSLNGRGWAEVNNVAPYLCRDGDNCRLSVIAAMVYRILIFAV